MDGALSRQQGKPRASSASQSGIQETPVDCMATVWMPRSTHQAARVWRSAVYVPKVRTICWASPSGTQATYAWAGFALRRSGTMASAALAHGVTPCEDETRPSAITLDHLWSRACASGSKPPVSDTCVIEDQRAGRDASHHSVVGSELVIAPLYYTLWGWGGTALFLPWGLPVRAW